MDRFPLTRLSSGSQFSLLSLLSLLSVSPLPAGAPRFALPPVFFRSPLPAFCAPCSVLFVSPLPAGVPRFALSPVFFRSPLPAFCALLFVRSLCLQERPDLPSLPSFSQPSPCLSRSLFCPLLCPHPRPYSVCISACTPACTPSASPSAFPPAPLFAFPPAFPPAPRPHPVRILVHTPSAFPPALRPFSAFSRPSAAGCRPFVPGSDPDRPDTLSGRFFYALRSAEKGLQRGAFGKICPSAVRFRRRKLLRSKINRNFVR